MRIGIIGGTGGMGKGFALRWSRNHDVVIGSRDAQRAAESAAEYARIAAEAPGQEGGGGGGGGGTAAAAGTISGGDNLSVARDSDVLVLSIPYQSIDAICSGILPEISDDCTVVSPIVPMTKTDVGFEFIPLKEVGSPFSYQLVAGHMKDPTRLVSAFHVISEKKLADPAMELDYDIFVCGDSKESLGVVNGLIGEIKGLRAIYLGPGSLSYMAEISTPILLNAMIRNGIRNPGIKVV